ncbi:MAG: hypothetical protein KBD25_03060 [Rickettsiaceae bacterium]|nr:hypothetical protein [Rickettsiaceae bacterium]
MTAQELPQTQDCNFWYNHVSAFVVSGKTQKEYCKEHSLKYSTFKGQRYKYADKFPVNENHPKALASINKKTSSISKPLNKFARVQVIEPSGHTTIKLYLKSNIYLELPADINSDCLNKYFKALGAV